MDGEGRVLGQDPDCLHEVLTMKMRKLAAAFGRRPAQEGKPVPFANFTPEQVKANLEKAAEARAAKAELLSRIRKGHVTLADVLSGEFAQDERVQKLQVPVLLKVLPGVGKVRTARIMDDLAIGENRRVRGLSARQRQGLLEWRNG